jgi:hypothetical protein
MQSTWRRLVGGLGSGLGSGLGRTDRALLRVRDSMTAGQRWTASLALVVVIAVLAFGMPSRIVTLPGYAAAAPNAGPVAAVPVPTPAAQAPPVAPQVPSVPIVGPVTPAPTPVPTPPTHAPKPPRLPSPGVPDVVALTETESSIDTLSSRNDVGYADAALSTAVFPYSVRTDFGPPLALCRLVVADGRVVVSAHSLRAPLENCLLAHGVLVISPSTRGTHTLAGGHRHVSGFSVGVRRGDLASLGDLASWAYRSHAVTGRVGVVLDAARRPGLASAPAVLRRHGVPVAATAWLGASSSAADVLAAVGRFMTAHVGTVVFGVPVAVQQKWAEESTLRVAQFRYLVSDIDDGVVDERYPATFDGALAHTSLRLPWYARAHGTTTAQQGCAAQYTAMATPPLELPDDQAPVDTWCEEVALLNRAVTAALVTAGDLTTTVLHLRMAAPLTSALGPLRHGRWGPTQDAVLVWRATCECWQQRTPFRPRQR